MKANWLLLSAAVFLTSCEKPAPIIAAAEPERKRSLPTKIEDTPDHFAPAPKIPDEAPAASDNKPAPPEMQAPPPPPPIVDGGVQEAVSVPGQAGFVYSPFNGKIVDVRELPPGTLVADPTFPASEKKHFRVPK